MSYSWFDASASTPIVNSLQLTLANPATAVVLACDDPVRNTSAIMGCMSIIPTFPVSPSVGRAQAERLLGRVRPGMVVVDTPDCALASAAFAAGWQVALLTEELTLNVIAPGRRADVAVYDDDIALLLQTSGTTGEPKLVGLTRENLQASCDGVVKSLGLDPQDRTLTLMPLTHIHGIVAVLGASLSAQAKVAIVPPRDPDAFWKHVEDVQPTWLSMVPTLLQSILSFAPLRKPACLNALRFIRTSSSALPPTLRAEAEAYFGVPVIEAYGMTEASHQIASSELQTTVPGVVGFASKDVDVSMRHADGTIVSPGEIGEVCVRGPNVMKGYLWPVEANEAAFHDDWFRTGDLGAISEDGQLRLTGRIKEQINRGGATLSPVEIEDALLEQPQIFEAVAFPVPHDALGEEVAALVVLRPGYEIEKAALQDQLTKTLDFEHCPKFIFFADALPKQASSGKVSRTAIAAEYAKKIFDDTPVSNGTDNHEVTLAGLLEIASKVLGGQHIAPDTSLFAYGLTSLDVFRLCAQIERTFGTRISPSDVLRNPTCAALAKQIGGLSAQLTTRDMTGVASVGPLLQAIATRQEMSAAPLRNMATVLIDVPKSVTDAAIVSAWQLVCTANPMLRAAPKIDGEDVVIDFASAPTEIATRQTAHTLPDLQSDFGVLHDILKPKEGPLLQPFILTCADDVRCLVVLINQFIADGYAHHILIRQLNMALADEVLPSTHAHLELCSGQDDPDNAVMADSLALVDPGTEPDFRTLSQDMPDAVWDAVAKTSRDCGVTPFAIGLAIFSHLMERLSGRAFPVWFATQKRRSTDDFMTIANATRPAFLQTQAKDASLATYADRVLAEVLAADVQVEHVPHRDSTPCWFEIANEAESLASVLGSDHGPLKALNIQSVDPGQSGVELSIYPNPGTFSLRYDRHLMSEAKAQAMLDGFVCLLGNALDAPDVPLNSLSAVAAPLSLPQWPAQQAARFQDITQDFQRLTKAQPTAVAIRSEMDEMTYAGLQNIVDELSQVLTNWQGNAPLRVATIAATGTFAVQSQIAVLAGFLAAQKTNAIFVPVAAQAPSQQCTSTLIDLGIDVVIGLRDDPRLEPLGQVLHDGVPHLPDVGIWALEPRDRPALPDVTEVIYSSSGTTGASKKICAGADRFVDYFNGLHTANLITPAPSLAGANASFDIWMYDVLYPLLSGHPVIFVREQRRTVDVLNKAAGMGVRNLSLTPSVAAAALEEDKSAFQEFQTLYLIGEALTPKLSTTLPELAPQTAVLNNYGTTETGVAATLQPLNAQGGKAVYLGKAIPGFEVLLVDPITQQYQAAGWPAEVVIIQPSARSEYVSAAASAEMNIVLADGRIAQRTGDIGVLSVDGQLSLLGRRDRQVQINGTRIELDAIEDIAETVEGISCAAAMCDAGDVRIQLYVATTSGAPVNALREQLRLHLPRSVRNLDVYYVAEIPLGPTGKKLRNAIELPKSASGNCVSAEETQAIPSGTIAEKIACLWQEILPEQTETHLHMNSDFFEVGGTSLAMLRLAGRIATVMACDIPEDELFANPILAAQADMIAQKQGAQSEKANRSDVVLLSQPNETPQRIRIIGLPSLFGKTSTIGMLAALDLPGVEIWVARPAALTGNIVKNGNWHQIVQDTADWIAQTPQGYENILAGTSFGGWLSWAVDLELQSRGFAPTAVLSLDGPASHLNPERPDLNDYVKQTLNRCANYRPPKMLLFHRTENTLVQNHKFFGSAWSKAEASPMTSVPIPTLDHRDFSRATFVKSQRQLIETFVNNADMQVLDTPLPTDLMGFRLYTLLERPHAPQDHEIRALLDDLTAEDITPFIGAAVLCLALSTRDEDLVGDAIAKIESAEMAVNGQLIDRAILYVRLAIGQIKGQRNEDAIITEEHRRALPARFLDNTRQRTSRVLKMRRAWHLPDKTPILSMKWIIRCFRYAEK